MHIKQQQHHQKKYVANHRYYCEQQKLYSVNFGHIHLL